MHVSVLRKNINLMQCNNMMITLDYKRLYSLFVIMREYILIQRFIISFGLTGPGSWSLSPGPLFISTFYELLTNDL